MSSNLVKVDRALIDKIKRLSEGTLEEQIEACAVHLCNEVFPDKYCKDPSVIPELLPLFVKFMDSDDPFLQREGAYFVMAVTCSSNEETETEAETTEEGNTMLAIEAGVVSRLIKLLSSPENFVVEQSLDCLDFIFARCPNDVFHLVDRGVLTSIKNVFDRLFVNAKASTTRRKKIIVTGRKSKFTANKVSQEKKLKSLAIRFIKRVTSFLDSKIDMIVEKGFIPIIIEQINAGVTTEIKIESIKILENIIKFKKDFVETLINDYNIIGILADGLRSGSVEFLQTILSALCTIFNIVEYKELSRQKFKDCGGPRKINKFLAHENHDIRDNANLIKDFVDNDVKPFPIGRNSAADTTELNGEDGNSVLVEEEAQTDLQNRKRSANSNVQTGKPGKRSKSLPVQTDTEPSVNPLGEHHDFDDLSNNPSPSNAAGDDDEELYNNNLDDINSSPSFSVPNAEPALPEATNTGVEHIQHNLISNASNPLMPSTVSPLPQTASNVDIKPSHVAIATSAENDTTFVSVRYYSPSEFTIDNHCQRLGLTFNSKAYREFLAKIDFQQIHSESKPKNVLPINDKSGFGCFSMLFTGTENETDLIKEKLNKQILRQYYRILNEETMEKVLFSSTLTEEHLKIIVECVKCRILVYGNGTWKRYGDWNSGADNVPLFVLKKEKIQGVTAFQIVLSLKD